MNVNWTSAGSFPVQLVKLSVFVLGSFLIFAGFAGCGRESNIDLGRFLQVELKRHPRSEIQDIYKLLYQGEFGSGHFIHSREGAVSQLREEIRDMPSLIGEPLHEPCSPDGRMIRVNLRPFVALNLQPDKLTDALVESANAVNGDTTAFLNRWAQVGELISDKVLPFELDEYLAFTADLQEQKFPAVHHSTGYADAYRPAYRVIRKDLYLKYFQSPE